MNYSCLGIIRDQDTGYAAKVLIHMYMSCDSRPLFLVDKGFNVRVLAVRHNAYKEKCRDDFTGTPSERADVWYWVHHGVHYYSNPWYYADETGWPADLITAIRMDEDNYPVIPAP